ncbi:MAG: ABC transporter ATP-binding protein [Candidatus Njordarchaeales archaeon]
MIEIKNFWFGYVPNKWLLKDIHLTISPGEKVLLAGPTGSGKTTLLYILAGFFPRFFNGVYSGTAKIDGISCIGGFEELKNVVGIALQDFENQLLGLTVEEEVALGLYNLNLPYNSFIRELEETLKTYSLEHLREKYVFNISFGEKQRVVLASVLSTRPKIVLLDEPFSQLDYHHQQRLLDILKKGISYKPTLVITEHDTGPFLDIVSRIIILDDGRVVFDGKNPSKELLREYGLEATTLSKKILSYSGKDLLLVKDLSCGWNRRQVVYIRDLVVREREITGITGPNGSGKTTILLTLTSFLSPIKGYLIKRKPITLVYQNPDNNILYPRVWDEVFRPIYNITRNIETSTKIAEELLEAFSLTRYRMISPWKLSRGERTKLAIASALAANPGILLLDEPTYGLDYRSISDLLDILSQFLEKNNMGIVIASHNKNFLRRVCDRIYEIRHGEVFLT